MHNPWLNIPASDYEAHMGAPGVGQLDLLRTALVGALNRYNPASLAVLGCATGNGLGRIDPTTTRRITGIDINPRYLEIAARRYARRLRGLSLVCADLERWDPRPRTFDMVYAALIFEYLSPGPLLTRIATSLTDIGRLVVVLQLSSDGDVVSDTGYTSLHTLEEILSLVDPDGFRETADGVGLEELRFRVERLGSGKRFYIGTYGRRGASAATQREWLSSTH